LLLTCTRPTGEPIGLSSEPGREQLGLGGDPALVLAIHRASGRDGPQGLLRVERELGPGVELELGERCQLPAIVGARADASVYDHPHAAVAPEREMMDRTDLGREAHDLGQLLGLDAVQRGLVAQVHAGIRAFE
jgi:hypothetical protein